MPCGIANVTPSQVASVAIFPGTLVMPPPSHVNIPTGPFLFLVHAVTESPTDNTCVFFSRVYVSVVLSLHTYVPAEPLFLQHVWTFWVDDMRVFVVTLGKKKQARCHIDVHGPYSVVNSKLG